MKYKFPVRMPPPTAPTTGTALFSADSGPRMSAGWIMDAHTHPGMQKLPLTIVQVATFILYFTVSISFMIDAHNARSVQRVAWAKMQC